MFTFLNASFLVGLLAVSLPFLIHLFNRQRVRTIPFSTLVFLKQLQHKKMRRLKLRQLLLLILRALVLGMVILAFARPSIKSGSTVVPGSQTQTVAVLILDNSLSMGLETDQGLLYQKAQLVAHKILNNFSNGDELHLLFTTDLTDVQIQKTIYSEARLIQLIDSSAVSYKYGDIWQAIEKGVELVEKSIYPNKEVYIISDFQKTGFPSEEWPRQIGASSAIRFYLIPCSDAEHDNVGITQVNLLDQILDKNKPVRLKVEIQNFGNRKMSELLVHCSLMGKRVAQEIITFPKRSSKLVEFRLIPTQRGLLNGTVEIEEDDLVLDDKAYFTLMIPEKTKVLCVGTGQSVRYFKLALMPTPEQESRFEIETITNVRTLPRSLDEYQVVALVNVPPLEGSWLDQLRQFVESGGGLVIIPGAQADLKFYNGHLLSRFDLPVFQQTIGQLGNTKAFVSLGSINWNHPIFQGMFKKKVRNLDSPQFNLILKTAPSAQVEEIIQFQNGNPFLLSKSLDQGKVLLFTSALDPGWSDLPFKAIFAPLVYCSVSYVSSSVNKANVQIKVGQTLETHLQMVTKDLFVVKPNGQRVRINPKAMGTEFVVRFSDTDLPGVYSLYSGEKLLQKWVVNIDPRESDLRLIKFNDLEKSLGNGVWKLDPEADFVQAIQKSRRGRELTVMFLGLALVLMLAEILLTSGVKFSSTSKEIQT